MASMARAGTTAANRIAAAMALVLVACTAELDPPDVDASNPPPADAGVDAATPPTHTGLRFQWDTLPPPVSGGGIEFELTEIHLALRDVRVIGDSAPGDSRTSIAKVELDWNDDHSPQAIEFPMAPPGLYSRFEFRVDENGIIEEGYWIRGKVTLPDEEDEIDFEITDTLPVPISLPLGNLELAVGGGETVKVSLNMGLVLASLDWQNLDVNGGKIKLDFHDPEMFAVRLALATAFSATVVPK
jgi:hypothetical protein